MNTCCVVCGSDLGGIAGAPSHETALHSGRSFRLGCFASLYDIGDLVASRKIEFDSREA